MLTSVRLDNVLVYPLKVLHLAAKHVQSGAGLDGCARPRSDSRRPGVGDELGERYALGRVQGGLQDDNV